MPHGDFDVLLESASYGFLVRDDVVGRVITGVAWHLLAIFGKLVAAGVREAPFSGCNGHAGDAGQRCHKLIAMKFIPPTADTSSD